MNEDRPHKLDTVKREYKSDVVAEALRNLDFSYVPVTPGSSFRGLHDSLVNHLGNEKPQMILCLHEEVAISVAQGYTTVVGRACPVLIHDLVGLMNGSMAVYNAFCGQAPVLVLGGGGPISRGAGRRPVDDRHSAQSQGELIREYVKWVDDPYTLTDAVASIYRAHQFAVSAPTGPTYVTVDVEMQEERIDEGYVAPDIADFAPAPPMAADPEHVARAAQLLVNAERPVIYVGGRVVHLQEAPDLIAELAESLGAAVQGSALPSAHPMNVTGTGAANDADVLLCIDVDDMSATLGGSGGGGLAGKTGDRKLIDLSSGDLRLKSWSNAFSASFRRDVQLLADPVSGLRLLVPAVKAITDVGVATNRAALIHERIAAARSRQKSHIAEHWNDPSISAARFTSELWEAVRGTNWLLGTHHPRLWYPGIFEFTDPSQTIANRGSGGGVGYNTGAAVGVALAARDRGQLAVAIVGDGDFLMAQSALWTAVHYHLPLLLVINDNHSFFNDEAHQRQMARSRNRPLENSWIGVHIDDPAVDFASLVRSFGCHGEGPISDPVDLKAVMSNAVEAVLAGKVAVVHVVTDATSVEQTT